MKNKKHTNRSADNAKRIKEAEISINVAYQYYKQARYSDALDYYKRGLVILESIYGAHDIVLSAAICGMGNVCEIQAHYVEALEHFSRALSIIKKKHGIYCGDFARILGNIANVFKCQSNYKEALEYYQRALSIQEKIHASGDAESAAILMNIGAIYDEQSNPILALNYYRRALSIEEKIYGPNHYDVALTIMNIGCVYYAQSRYAEALYYFTRALTIQEKTYGMAHPDVSRTLSNIGSVYFVQLNYTGALTCYDRALKNNETIFGPDHPSVANALNHMGDIHNRMGQYDDALRYYERALDIQEKIHGCDHPSAGKILSSIGTLLSHQHRDVEALAYYRRSFALQQKLYEPGQVDLTATLMNIARTQSYNHHCYPESLSCYQRAYASFLSSMGKYAPETSEAQQEIARVYEQWAHLSITPLDKKFQYVTQAITVLVTLRESNVTLLTQEPDFIQNVYDLTNYCRISKQLGRLYRLQGQYDVAYLLYIEEAQRWKNIFPFLGLHYIYKAERITCFLSNDHKRYAALLTLKAQILAHQKRWPLALEAWHSIPEQDRVKDADDVVAWKIAWGKEQKAFLDSDLSQQWQRCLESFDEIQNMLFKDMFHNILSDTVKNKITEIIIKLRNILDPAYARFIRDCFYIPNNLKQDTDEYFPIGSSEITFKEKLQNQRKISVEYFPYNFTNEMDIFFSDSKLTHDEKKYFSEFSNKSRPEHVLTILVNNHYLAPITGDMEEGVKKANTKKVPKGYILSKEIDLTKQNQPFQLPGCEKIEPLIRQSLYAAVSTWKNWNYLNHSPASMPAVDALFSCQPFRYYEAERNLSHDAKGADQLALWNKSWLDIIIAIGNDSKHIRLTPQSHKQALQNKKGLFSQKGMKIFIDYIETRGVLHTWSFVSELLDVVSNSERILLSKKICDQFQKDGILVLKNKQLICNPACSKEFLDFVRSGVNDDNESNIQSSFSFFEKKVMHSLNILKESALQDYHSKNITQLLLRRACQDAHLSFTPDRCVDIEVLFQYALEGTFKMATALGSARASQDTTCEPIKKQYGTALYLPPLYYALQKTHERVKIILQENDIASAVNIYEQQCAIFPNTLHTMLYKRLVWLSGNDLNMGLHRLQLLRGLAEKYKNVDLLRFCVNAHAKAHDIANYTVALNSHIGQAFYKIAYDDHRAIYKKWHEAIPQDLRSQMEYVMEKVHGLHYDVIVADTLWKRSTIENVVAELILKLHHVLDQSITRWINRALRLPRREGLHQFHYPCRATEEGLCKWAMASVKNGGAEWLPAQSAEHATSISKKTNLFYQLYSHSPVWQAILNTQPFAKTHVLPWLPILITISNTSKHAYLPHIDWSTDDVILLYQETRLSEWSFVSLLPSEASSVLYKKLFEKNWLVGLRGYETVINPEVKALAHAVFEKKSDAEQKMRLRALQDVIKKTFLDILKPFFHNIEVENALLSNIGNILIAQVYFELHHRLDAHTPIKSVPLFMLLETAIENINVLIEKIFTNMQTEKDSTAELLNSVLLPTLNYSPGLFKNNAEFGKMPLLPVASAS